jgi:hypothetical protein
MCIALIKHYKLSKEVFMKNSGLITLVFILLLVAVLILQSCKATKNTAPSPKIETKTENKQEPPTTPVKSPFDEQPIIKALKDLVDVEAVWRQQDVDGDGIKDYWTYDVSCFHRMYRADRVTKVDFIPQELAIADAAPADDKVLGDGVIESWSCITDKPQTYGGYFFRVIEKDEIGNNYNQNPGNNKIAVTNNSKFAFVAYPEKYGVTGINTFIVNETGKIYSTDCGSDTDKIVLYWPGADPTQLAGPGCWPWKEINN